MQKKNHFFLVKNNFQPREFPQSGSKAKDVKEREKVGNNNGQLRIANATSGGARKPPGQKLLAACLRTDLINSKMRTILTVMEVSLKQPTTN